MINREDMLELTRRMTELFDRVIHENTGFCGHGRKKAPAVHKIGRFCGYEREGWFSSP
jgi:hypothetical protein